MKKYWFSLFAAGWMVLMFLKVQAQSITASEVETWITNDFPSSDFNLNSAYVFLLNGNMLSATFEGEGLNRNLIREVGLKKGDYPQYMYLAVQIADPVNEGNSYTIPLMIHDIKDLNNQTRVTEYGGRVLENIPDEVLKNGDIVAKVRFEAFKGNSSSEFWKRTAQISIDLGKTATNLLQAPLTGNFLSLTQQILPKLSQGLKSLENTEDTQKITHDFYIKLLSKELSALYEERVVGATLYKIHWDVEHPAQSRFFRNATVNRVDDFKRLVNHSKSTYILVVNTKSEYNTDHSELVYNMSYIEKKSKDFRKITNATKKEVEKEFLETLKLAVELKKQIDIFQGSLNTKYPDWLAFSKIIDLYYDIRQQKEGQNSRLQGMELSVREKYSRLYANVINDIDLWFNNELLIKCQEIGGYLVENAESPDYRRYASAPLYSDIELLDFFRDRVKQTEIQGKIPKEIEALETYNLTTRRLREMETILFQKEFYIQDELSGEAQKQLLLNRVTNDYPLCQVCSEKVRDRLIEIDNLTHEQNIRKYKEISANYYANLECFDNVIQKLQSYIKVNTDSMTISEFMLAALQKDRQELEKLSSSFNEVIGRDYTKLKPKELEDLLSQYYLTREKLSGIVERLKGVVLEEKEICL